MKIQIYVKPHAAHQKEWLCAFAEGLLKQGAHTFDICFDAGAKMYKDADLHVAWSMKHPHVIQQCTAHNKPFLCLERGYIDRINFASVNLNGLNGRSALSLNEFHGNDSRVKKHGWTAKPWRKPGDVIVIMGQMPGDSSMDDVSPYKWAQNIYDYYKKYDVEAVYRPHPLDNDPQVNIPILEGSIEEAFDVASFFVTYSSNVAVDAWINGVPALSFGACSMIEGWFDADGKTSHVKNWLNDLSFRQYNIEEFESGEAWQTIGRKILGH